MTWENYYHIILGKLCWGQAMGWPIQVPNKKRKWKGVVIIINGWIKQKRLFVQKIWWLKTWQISNNLSYLHSLKMSGNIVWSKMIDHLENCKLLPDAQNDIRRQGLTNASLFHANITLPNNSTQATTSNMLLFRKWTDTGFDHKLNQYGTKQTW